MTFQSCGGAATVGSITLGDNASNIAPPSNIIFTRGSGSVNVPGGIYAAYTASTQSQNVTIDGLRVCVDANVLSPCVNLHSVKNWTITNNTIGPMCCGEDGSAEGIRLGITAGDPDNANVTIRGNVIEGVLRYCNYWPSSGHGSCPGTTSPSAHPDGIHMWGVSNITIDQNRLYNISVQGIFVETAGISTDDNLTITNNLVGLNQDTGLGAIKFVLEGPNRITGTNTIAFNTTPDRIQIDGLAPVNGNTVFKIIGNVAQVHTTSAPPDGPGSCFGGLAGATVTYRYNVETGPIGPCDPTDLKASVPLVNTALLPATTMDLHLAGAPGSTAADDFVPAATCLSVVSRDVDGATRPTDAECDAGGDERCTCPTAIVVRLLAARASEDAVVITWRTEAERSTLGFNVFGERHEVRTRLNTTLIRARHSRGGGYVFRSRLRGPRFLAYWLQTLGADGSKRWYRATTTSRWPGVGAGAFRTGLRPAQPGSGRGPPSCP